ncbi:MAG: MCE family protein [Bacteroidales bacterium]|nr:MCE family protein [Bacteroidales bacterium]MCF8405054.1 MCE family protein [Bacteroidales bacterium]
MNKIFWIISVILLLILISVGAYYFLYEEKQTDYYVMILGPSDAFEVGFPVLIQGIEKGKIADVKSFTDPYVASVLSLKLAPEINIPKQSTVTLNQKSENSPKNISIELVASKGYYFAGDTIFVNLKKPDPDKNVVKESTYYKEPAVSPKTEPRSLESGAEIKVYSGPVFKIQILVSSRELEQDSKMFRGLKEVEMCKEGKVYKYFYGHTGSYGESLKKQEEARKAGLKDAFVVAYLNEKRISIKEARSLKN